MFKSITARHFSSMFKSKGIKICFKAGFQSWQCEAELTCWGHSFQSFACMQRRTILCASALKSQGCVRVHVGGGVTYMGLAGGLIWPVICYGRKKDWNGSETVRWVINQTWKYVVLYSNRCWDVVIHEIWMKWKTWKTQEQKFLHMLLFQQLWLVWKKKRISDAYYLYVHNQIILVVNLQD